MNRSLAALLSFLLISSSVGVPTANAASAPSTRATTVTPLDMMASTVQILVHVNATKLGLKPEPIKSGWAGSGVVYEKKGNKSLVLSANHVLDAPVPGSIEDVTGFFGQVIGKQRIDSVEIKVRTFDGRTCNAKVLKLGVTDSRDTATAEVDCDAGRVAKIATATPARGERIYVSGHPMGVPVAMVTEGFVAGNFEDDGSTYLLLSAQAFSGNSGGPVFYRGQVIGLLVRGSSDYSQISMATPLESVLIRISETPHLK